MNAYGRGHGQGNMQAVDASIVELDVLATMHAGPAITEAEACANCGLIESDQIPLTRL